MQPTRGLCGHVRWKLASFEARTGEEKAAAADTHTSYCGRYEMQGDTAAHYIELSLFPNWVGVDQKRIFRFDGNRLLLSTPPILADGIERTSHLIWERV